MRLSFDGGRIDERGVAVDAGLNARRSREAFGLSIAEFLSDSRKAVQCVTLKAAVGAEFSFRLRAASIPGCVSLVSDAEERARDGL